MLLFAFNTTWGNKLEVMIFESNHSQNISHVGEQLRVIKSADHSIFLLFPSLTQATISFPLYHPRPLSFPFSSPYLVSEIPVIN